MSATLSTPATPYGSVTRAADGTYSVHYERRLNHPIDRVWQALTDYDQLKKWFGLIRFPETPGTGFILDYPHGNVTFEAVLKTRKPMELLEYDWFDEDDGKSSVVRWQLREEGPGQTLITIEQTGIRKELRSWGPGWHLHLDMLTEVLDGKVDVFIWRPEIMDAYRSEYTRYEV